MEVKRDEEVSIDHDENGWLREWAEVDCDNDAKPVKTDSSSELLDFDDLISEAPESSGSDCEERERPLSPEKNESRKTQSDFCESAPMSREIKNLCTFECPTCSQNFKSYYSVYDHMKKLSHRNVKNGQAILQTCLVNAVAHECFLCSKKILCDRFQISAHLQRVHKISLAKYYDKFGRNLGKSETSLPLTMRQVSNLEKRQELENVLQKVVKMAETTSETGSLCSFKCPDCSQSIKSWITLRNHLKSKGHANGALMLIDVEKYLVRGRAQKCDICSDKILADYSFLQYHTRVKHDMTIQEYFKKYKSEYGIISRWKTKVSEGFEESKELGNKCTFSCKMCQKSLTSVNTLWIHLRKTNHMPKENSVFVAMKTLRTYSCLICSTRLVCDLTSVKGHCQIIHKISLKQYYEKTGTTKVDRNTYFANITDTAPISTIAKDLCEFACTMCLYESTSWDKMRIHIRIDHKVFKEGNPVKYLTKITMFQCGKCPEKMLCDRVFTRNHETMHNPTPAGDESSRQRKRLGYVEFKKQEKQMLVNRVRKLMELRESIPTFQAKANTAFLKPSSEDIKTTKSACNLCTFSCEYCDGKRFIAWNILRGHYKTEHKGRSLNYDPQRVVEGRYHQCCLCPKVILCDALFIRSHSEGAHRLSLNQYYSVTKTRGGETFGRITQTLWDSVQSAER